MWACVRVTCSVAESTVAGSRVPNCEETFGGKLLSDARWVGYSLVYASRVCDYRYGGYAKDNETLAHDFMVIAIQQQQNDHAKR